MRVTEIRLERLTAIGALSHGPPETPRARPSDVYGRPDRIAVAAPVRQIFVTIGTDVGVEGVFGPISAIAAFLIDTVLREVVLGHDPRATVALWDRMRRLDFAGRAGDFAGAIGALDCALWDVKARALGVPVYALLGGPTRQTVPAIASMMDFPHQLDLVRAAAASMVDAGFGAQKWFPARGPAQGPAGMAETVQLIATVRETVGPDIDVMIDAWTAWDYDYAVRMLRMLEPYRLRWVEEPLPARDVARHHALRHATGATIAGGEHLFGRDELKPFLDAGAFDVPQFDLVWGGGLTEALRSAALIESFGLPTVPHGASLLATLHMVMAQPPMLVPFISYVVRLAEREQSCLAARAIIRDGVAELPPGPGFGITFDSSRIAYRERLVFQS